MSEITIKSIEQAIIPNWICVSDAMPKQSVPVIVCGLNEHHKIRRLRAIWVPKYSIEEQDDFTGEPDYNIKEDVYYWPEGWYEFNEYEEIHWLIQFPVLYWMNLPEVPESLLEAAKNV